MRYARANRSPTRMSLDSAVSTEVPFTFRLARISPTRLASAVRDLRMARPAAAFAFLPSARARAESESFWHQRENPFQALLDTVHVQGPARKPDVLLNREFRHETAVFRHIAEARWRCGGSASRST